MTNRFTIRAVEARTGLSQHTIRAWERRYGALSPHRTDTNRRVYSDDDVEKLTLLRAALAAGHSISQVATMSVEALKTLLSRGGMPTSLPSAGPVEVAGAILAQCQRAVEDFDPTVLMANLERGSAILGLDALVTAVIAPFVEWIGSEWHRGGLRIGQEHMASAVVRSFLDKARAGLAPKPGATTVVVATPVGQHHELGAQMIAVRLSVSGYRVVYLGVDLPSVEIAYATLNSGAKTVCLSVVYPADDPLLSTEIERLAQYLGPDVSIVMGGRAATSYESAIRAAGAVRADSLDDLSRLIEKN